MIAARRVYVYLVSAIALGILVAGLIQLLRLVADAFGVAPAFAESGDQMREQLSLALALTAVGLPLWGAHTWYAERLAAREDRSGADERASTLRAVYLAGAGVVTLFIGASAAIATLESLIVSLIAGGSVPDGGRDLAVSLASAVVLLGAYLVLGRFRLRDLDAGPLIRAAAAIARLALYGASLVGLLVLLAGALGLLGLVIDLAVGPAPAGSADWWRDSLAHDLSMMVVGGTIWGLHRGFAERLAARDDEIGAAERRSRMRVAEQAVFLVIAAGFALVGVGSALGTLLTGLIGSSADLPLRDVLDPLLGAAVYLGVLLIRRAAARHEAFAFGGADRLGAVVRLTDLAVAFVGLAFVAVGMARSIAIVLEAIGGAVPLVAGPGPTGDLLRMAAFALVGVPVWVWGWWPALRRAQLQPSDEAGSAIRRGYLFLVSGTALVATAGGIAIVLYQGLRAMLSLQGAAFIDQSSDALGTALIGGLLLGYHAGLLRWDARQRIVPAGSAPGLVPRLVIRGPADAALDGLADRLAAVLPAGWTAEAVEGEATTVVGR